jgi:hypothetical protein
MYILSSYSTEKLNLRFFLLGINVKVGLAPPLEIMKIKVINCLCLNMFPKEKFKVYAIQFLFYFSAKFFENTKTIRINFSF